MAQPATNVLLRTVSSTDYTAALAQNAAIESNFRVNPLTGQAKSIVRSISIISVENLAWELQFWSTDLFDTGAIDTQKFRGRWSFGTADGVRNAGAGNYFYYIDGLYIPYQDLDETSEVHMALVNRSAAGKSANAGGAIVVQVTFEPTLGW